VQHGAVAFVGLSVQPHLLCDSLLGSARVRRYGSTRKRERLCGRMALIPRRSFYTAGTVERSRALVAVAHVRIKAGERTARPAAPSRRGRGSRGRCGLSVVARASEDSPAAWLADHRVCYHAAGVSTRAASITRETPPRRARARAGVLPSRSGVGEVAQIVRDSAPPG
jgi:hypothetical protein